ncbi:MAG: ATP-binding protein [Oceanipulchritudo sp.]
MSHYRSEPDEPEETPLEPVLGQAILGSTPHCVAVISDDLKLVYGNLNFFRFLKNVFDLDLGVGDSLGPVLPKERALRWQLRMEEVLGGQCKRVEEVLEVKGETRYFDVAYQPLDERGRNEWDRIVLFFEEITARKRSEKRLRERETELEESIATRETLLSVISHDLRSPVFQLNGLLFMIRQSAESRDEGRLQMYAEDLEERISHLTHTIDNVLSWSSLQRQSLEPKISRFSLESVLEHAIGLLKPVAQPKGVNVRTTCHPGMELSSDREMVAFIIRNLVNNAIKFSREGGRIDISAEATDGYVSFSVLDHGVGFAPEEILSVREGGRRLSKTGTWGEHGTGIGLKTCYEFAARLGGSLDIVSAQNEGTATTLRLPQMGPSDAAQSA